MIRSFSVSPERISTLEPMSWPTCTFLNTNGLIGVDSRDLDAVLPEHQGGGRNAQRLGIGLDVEVNLGKGSRPQFAFRIVGLQLHQGGARFTRDRV